MPFVARWTTWRTRNRRQSRTAAAGCLAKALQPTTMLRDVRTDTGRGRIYLPLEARQRFQVRPEEILELQYSSRFRELARSVAGRAREFYRQARQPLPDEDRRAM